MRWLLLLTLLLLPTLPAQTFDLPNRAPRPALFDIERGGGHQTMHDMGNISFGGSVGIGFSPLGFYGTVEADFWLTSFFSLGPTAQVLVGDHFILGITATPKFTLDFGHEWSELVKPYVQLGPGIAVVSGHNHRHDHHTQLGLLILLGLGVDFYIWENVSLGTGLMFNYLPTYPVDEGFFFGWKLIEAKVHF
jgi:hypothetical protein